MSKYTPLILPLSTMQGIEDPVPTAEWVSNKITSQFNSPITPKTVELNTYKYITTYMAVSYTLSEELFRVHAYHKNFFSTEVGSHYPPFVNINRYLTH